MILIIGNKRSHCYDGIKKKDSKLDLKITFEFFKFFILFDFFTYFFILKKNFVDTPGLIFRTPIFAKFAKRIIKKSVKLTFSSAFPKKSKYSILDYLKDT